MIQVRMKFQSRQSRKIMTTKLYSVHYKRTHAACTYNKIQFTHSNLKRIPKHDLQINILLYVCVFLTQSFEIIHTSLRTILYGVRITVLFLCISLFRFFRCLM